MVIGAPKFGSMPFEFGRGQKNIEGAKLYPMVFNSNGVAQTVLQSFRDLGLNTLATVWIDNSANPFPFSITFNGTGQQIVAAPVSQGFYPVLCTPQMLNITVFSKGTVNVPVFFINKEILTDTWFAANEASGQYTQQKIVTGNFGPAAGGTLTLAPDAANQAFLAGFSVSALGGVAGSYTVQIGNLFGGTGSLFWVVQVPANPGDLSPPLVVNFNPPLQGNGVGVGPNLILPSLGAGGVWTGNLWGYEI
jgi:hypothetical protein